MENKLNYGVLKHNIPKKSNDYGHKLIQDYVNKYELTELLKNDKKESEAPNKCDN